MHKIITVGAACLAALLASVTPSVAASGSAVITFYRVYYSTASTRTIVPQITVTNVSASDVVVTLKLWDKDGLAVDSPSFGATVVAFPNFTSCNASSTSCTLPAGKSATFSFTSIAGVNVDRYGYGTLEWSSTGNEPAAIVADGMILHTEAAGQMYTRTMVITKAQPF